jgi:hypothetical protein
MMRQWDGYGTYQIFTSFVERTFRDTKTQQRLNFSKETEKTTTFYNALKTIISPITVGCPIFLKTQPADTR